MISTRLHGAIDYAVALLFGRLAINRALPRAVRATFGTVGAYHTGYSVLTDYEAGIVPTITMRQHLALDIAGAATLLGAGALMRRQPMSARILLLAAGVAECFVIARSAAEPVSGPGSGAGIAGRMLGADAMPIGDVAETPLDVLKRVTEDLFVVDSDMRGPLGVTIPVRMTVIRLPGGELILHSPTRFTPGLRQALERLGSVRHLVAPSMGHWSFISEWQRAFPDAVTWAAPGLRNRGQVQRSGVRLDHDLNEAAPPGWEGIDLFTIPGIMGFHEVALFHRPSSALVVTDLVANLHARQVPPAVRPVARLMGLVNTGGQPPIYLRAVVALRGKWAADAARRLLALGPERVIFAHGPWFTQNGAEGLRRALRWLVT